MGGKEPCENIPVSTSGSYLGSWWTCTGRELHTFDFVGFLEACQRQPLECTILLKNALPVGLKEHEEMKPSRYVEAIAFSQKEFGWSLDQGWGACGSLDVVYNFHDLWPQAMLVGADGSWTPKSLGSGRPLIPPIGQAVLHLSCSTTQTSIGVWYLEGNC